LPFRGLGRAGAICGIDCRRRSFVDRSRHRQPIAPLELAHRLLRARPKKPALHLAAGYGDTASRQSPVKRGDFVAERSRREIAICHSSLLYQPGPAPSNGTATPFALGLLIETVKEPRRRSTATN
jgi:hypothetical protein